jgi:hypothetical protein
MTAVMFSGNPVPALATEEPQRVARAAAGIPNMAVPAVISVRAHRTTAWNFAAVSTAFGLDTVDWDTNAGYNAGTGAYTVPQDGKYQVLFQVGGTTNNAGHFLVASLFKNGVLVSQNYSPASSTPGSKTENLFALVVDTIDCKAGDTFSTQVWSDLATMAGVAGTENTYMVVSGQ